MNLKIVSFCFSETVPVWTLEGSSRDQRYITTIVFSCTIRLEKLKWLYIKFFDMFFEVFDGVAVLMKFQNINMKEKVFELSVLGTKTASDPEAVNNFNERIWKQSHPNIGGALFSFSWLETIVLIRRNILKYIRTSKSVKRLTFRPMY